MRSSCFGRDQPDQNDSHSAPSDAGGPRFPHAASANHDGPILQTDLEALRNSLDWLGSAFGFVMFVFAFFTLVFIVLIILLSSLLDAFGEALES
ncbi:MAG: hypothetical protein WCC94_11275 [Candidatus Bathyarchaeia archaeon]